jgi:hypothetical protein
MQECRKTDQSGNMARLDKVDGNQVLNECEMVASRGKVRRTHPSLACNENIGLLEAVVRLRPSTTMCIFISSVLYTMFHHCYQCIVSVISTPVR